MHMTILPERPDSAEARELIGELDDLLAGLYAVESRHGYSVDKLLRQGVHFFLVRVDDRPAGCGGVQFFGKDFAELKRMYVRPAFRGRGLARQLLETLASHAQAHGITTLRLETGIHQKEAIALYERFGFRRIPPFGDYRPDPVSLCYEMRRG